MGYKAEYMLISAYEEDDMTEIPDNTSALHSIRDQWI